MKTFCYSKAQHKPEKSLRPETEEWLNDTSQAKHSRLLSNRCIKLRRRPRSIPLSTLEGGLCGIHTVRAAGKSTDCQTHTDTRSGVTQTCKKSETLR